MRVEIQLRPDVAAELHEMQSPAKSASALKPDTAQVLDEARKLDIQIEPTHPGQTHPVLAPFFYTEVADAATADKVVERLSKLDGVEAAYVKPPPMLP